jgi:predicted oxidoreductase
MKTQMLGPTETSVTRLCYGAMRIAGCWDRKKVDAVAIEKGVGILEAAVEAGYTFIDHADIYGDTMCEAIHGQAVKKHPDWREKLFVATKCAVRSADVPPGSPHRYDFSAEHVRWSVDESLKRLNLERIDLYQLHRPDWLADPTEIAATMVDLTKAGKVRYFGLSNCRPSLVEAIQSALPFPLLSNQVRINLFHLETFEDGTLDQCLTKKMTPLAWSPLADGRLAAAFDDTIPVPSDDRCAAAVARLRPVLAATAKAYGVTPLVIVLAWLMRHPSKIIPIIGTIRPEMMRNATEADKIDLDRESWYRILLAARGKNLE